MKFDIRPSHFGDAESMIALLNPIIEEGVFTMMTEPLTLTSQLDWISHVQSNGVELLAFDESGKLAGMQSVEPLNGDAQIGDISTFIHAEFRGVGLGRDLFFKVHTQVEKRGFRILVARIRADNLRAIAFYESLGFRHSVQHFGVFQGKPIVTLKKDLESHSTD